MAASAHHFYPPVSIKSYQRYFYSPLHPPVHPLRRLSLAARRRKDIPGILQSENAIIINTGHCKTPEERELEVYTALVRHGRSKEEDALTVYQGQVEPVLARKNNEAYREAVALLRKVRGLMARLGKEPNFQRYLESVRMKHKPKRNFIKMLDRAKW